MKKIALRGKLGKGKYALVDDHWFEPLNSYKWYFDGHYVYRNSNRFDKGPRRVFRIHEQICKPPKGMHVDHKNHNVLDEQEANLRVCTRKENAHNSQKPKNNTSGYKGVSWHKSGNGWRATLQMNGKQLSLSSKNLHHAALMYDLWAVDLYGEFACTNFDVVAYSKKGGATQAAAPE
jgi:hypothetical protein